MSTQSTRPAEFWKSQRVVVTGGAGFLGSFVVRELQASGCEPPFIPRSKEFDLRESAHIKRLLDAARPTMIIHLAAVVGGIGANRRNPGRFFFDNAVMGIQLLEQARQYGVAKTVLIGTVCAYPKFTPPPFKESALWDGYPEETNAPYGLAKKMLLVQAQAYRQQYGTNAIFLLPANLYGPGDNFDLEDSHVIPALIRKMSDAKQQRLQTVQAWGSGKATREFLYARDAARGIVLAAERYNGSEPVNLGTGQEVSIASLAETIREAVGFSGSIEWDRSKPDGQPRRVLDTSLAERAFGFKAATSLRDGLAQTVAWFNKTYLRESPSPG
jgi:GDP-L-fucose synthase